MDSKKRTLKRLGIAGVATAMTTLGVPALASAATFHNTPGAASQAVAGVPSQPLSLKATGGPGQVSLTWKAPSNVGNSNVLGYNVYIGTQSGAEQGPVNGGVLVTGTSYTVTGLTDGTPYFVEVTAVNSQGESTPSTEATATPVATAPAAPTGVSATAGYQEATVNWTVPSDGGSAIQSFIITPMSGTTALNPITVAAGNAGTPLDPTPGASDSYTVPGLTNGTAYTFTVKAANGVGTGAASAASGAVTPGLSAPNMPTGVTAAANANDTAITVSWTPPTNDGGSSVLGYNVYEATSPGAESATPVNGSSLVNSPYVVTPVTAGKTYYFTVKAVNANGASAASAESSGVSIPLAVTPDAPTAVSAIAGYQSAVVNFTVPKDPGTAISGFTIAATDHTVNPNTTVDYTVPAGAVGSSTDPTPGAKDTVVVPSAATTQATALADGDAYTFTVSATNTGSAGGTGPTSAASNTVVPNPTAPTPVTGLQAATSSSSNTEIDLNWTGSVSSGNGSPLAGYNIYEGTSTTPLNGGTPVTTNSYAATGLTQGTTYNFTVKAVNSTGVESTGTSVSATAGNPTPSAPTGLMASPGNGDVVLSWTPSTYQGTGTATYNVLNGTTVVNTAPITGNSYTVPGLTNGSSYTYTVEAVSGANVPSVNNPSVQATPATVPGTPGTPTATGVSPTSVKVSWAAPTGNGGSPITGYAVTALDTTTAANGGQTCTTTGTTSCTVTGLTTGDSYTFTVVASNAEGPSSASSASNAITAGPVAPGAPTSVVANANGTNVTVKWAAPKSNGGSAIVGYNIYVSPSPTNLAAGSPVNGDVLVTGTSAIIDGTMAGLFSGQHYFLSVQAVSAGSTSNINGPLSTPVEFATSPGVTSTTTISATSLRGPGDTVISGVTAPNATVTLFDQAYGKSTFFKKAIGTSDSSGAYSFKVHIDKTNHFYVVVDGVQSQTVAANVTGSAPSPKVHVYVTPPKMIAKAGVTTIRVTTSRPGVQVHLFDEAFGTSHFFQKKIMTTTAQSNGTGVAIFKIGIARTNKFFVVADGTKSNTVVARVK